MLRRLVVAALAIGMAGALVERYGLRPLHKYGHIPELLFTFGLSYLIIEIVQLVWGRAAVAYPVPKDVDLVNGPWCPMDIRVGLLPEQHGWVCASCGARCHFGRCAG